MTNKEILELAKSCGFDSFTGEKGDYWECWEDQLIEFAKSMYNKGKNDEAELYVDENY